MKISTVFTDRDGVLNVDKPDYLLRLEDVEIHEDVPAALARLTKAGIRVIVISNQAGIGKELISKRAAEAIFDEVIREAESAGGHIDAYYYCPHTWDDECNCRKPGIALFLRAAREHAFDIKGSVMIGDGFGDARAAEHLRVPFFLVEQGWGPVTKVKCDSSEVPYQQVRNFSEAADAILKLNEGSDT